MEQELDFDIYDVEKVKGYYRDSALGSPVEDMSAEELIELGYIQEAV